MLPCRGVLPRERRLPLLPLVAPPPKLHTVDCRAVAWSAGNPCCRLELCNACKLVRPAVEPRALREVEANCSGGGLRCRCC